MIVPIIFTTPDGVERVLRFTLAARKRNVDLLRDNPADEIGNRHPTDDQIPILLYNCMFDDQKGTPPPGITPAYLLENYEPTQLEDLYAQYVALRSQGKVDKKKVLELFAIAKQAEAERIAAEKAALSSAKTTNATSSGASPATSSGSAEVPQPQPDSPVNSGTSRRVSSRKSRSDSRKPSALLNGSQARSVQPL